MGGFGKQMDGQMPGGINMYGKPGQIGGLPISSSAPSVSTNMSAQQEIKMHKNETDLNQILKKRIEGI